jgi:hypothetical protein
MRLSVISGTFACVQRSDILYQEVGHDAILKFEGVSFISLPIWITGMLSTKKYCPCLSVSVG